MRSKRQFQSSCSLLMARAVTASLALAIGFALAAVLSRSAQGQTFTVIHNFTNGWDGGNPYSGLTIDATGNLYGPRLTEVFFLTTAA